MLTINVGSSKPSLPPGRYHAKVIGVQSVPNKYDPTKMRVQFALQIVEPPLKRPIYAFCNMASHIRSTIVRWLMAMGKTIVDGKLTIDNSLIGVDVIAVIDHIPTVGGAVKSKVIDILQFSPALVMHPPVEDITEGTIDSQQQIAIGQVYDYNAAQQHGASGVQSGGGNQLRSQVGFPQSIPSFSSVFNVQAQPVQQNIQQQPPMQAVPQQPPQVQQGPVFQPSVPQTQQFQQMISPQVPPSVQQQGQPIIAPQMYPTAGPSIQMNIDQNRQQQQDVSISVSDKSGVKKNSFIKEIPADKITF